MKYTDLDISSRIGPLYPKAETREWPMYSYERPADYFWNGFANELQRRGLNENQIKDVLQSKLVRWMFDAHGDALEDAGKHLARTISIKDAKAL